MLLSGMHYRALQTTPQYPSVTLNTFFANPTHSLQTTRIVASVFHTMLTTSLAWLVVLAPALSRASPIATPGDLASLEKRIGNVGSFATYFPDCSEDPSYAVGTSQYQDGSGVYVGSSCDNGLSTPAVNRFHCW